MKSESLRNRRSDRFDAHVSVSLKSMESKYSLQEKSSCANGACEIAWKPQRKDIDKSKDRKAL